MAFLRFTRDKRGYEHFYLVQPSQRRGKSTARVLYWFRTPPNVKVGREPFDERIRRELEAQTPDVTFDWRKILETPIPSADAEKWRERRRLERAARAARRDAPGREPGDVIPEPGDVVQESGEAVIDDEELLDDAPVHVLEAAAEAVAAELDLSVPPDVSQAGPSNESVDGPKAEPGAPEAAVELRAIGSGEVSHQKRRRRRRRRGRPGPPESGGAPPAGPAGDV